MTVCLPRKSDNNNEKSCKYVCITTNQPDTKSNPNPKPNHNPNSTTKAARNIIIIIIIIISEVLFIVTLSC